MTQRFEMHPKKLQPISINCDRANQIIVYSEIALSGRSPCVNRPYYFGILFYQPIVQTLLFGVATYFYCLLAGGFICYGRCGAAYVHACFLHCVGTVGKCIVVGGLADHLKSPFGIIADDLPICYVHRLLESYEKETKVTLNRDYAVG